MTIREISAQDYRDMLRGKRRKGLPRIAGVAQNEREFQSSIVKAAAELGWTHYHTQYAPGSDTGYPDLTLVHSQHGVIWLELKTYNGTVSWEQTQWIERLREAGQQAHIIYPDDVDLLAALLQGHGVEVEEQTR